MKSAGVVEKLTVVVDRRPKPRQSVVGPQLWSKSVQALAVVVVATRRAGGTGADRSQKAVVLLPRRRSLVRAIFDNTQVAVGRPQKKAVVIVVEELLLAVVVSSWFEARVMGSYYTSRIWLLNYHMKTTALLQVTGHNLNSITLDTS